MLHKYVFSAALAASAFFQTVYAAKPQPPPRLCIDETGVCVNTITAAVPKVKWHPGHYVLGTTVDHYSASQVAALATEPNILGWEQLVSWAKVEPARGQYDWSLIDGLLDACKTHGKRLIVQVLDRSFAGADSARLPEYLAGEPGGEGGWYVKPNGGVIAKIWLTPVMDRLIALYRVIGARYDGDPYFEGVFTAESDAGFSVGPRDYTAAAYASQLYRLDNALPAAFAHTNVWLSANFLGSGEKAMEKLIAQASSSRVGISGPDVITANSDHSDSGSRVLRGLTWNGSAWTSGGTDYRGKIAIAHDVESPELGGKEGGFTMDQIYAQSYHINGDAHLIWERKDYAVPSKTKNLMWATDILPWLHAGGHPTHTQCPTFYANGCDSR